MSENETGDGVTRRDFTRTLAVGGAMIGAGGLLQGCFGGDDASTGQSTSAAASKPKKGGTLRIGLAAGGTGDTLDPYTPLSSADSIRGSLFYEQLTQVENNYELQNVLAESMEPNADFTEWTVQLRQGVEFHNGKTLEADDLLFTLQRMFDPKVGAFAADQLGAVNLKKTKKLDKRTVRIVLDQPDAYFAIALGDGGITGVIPVGFDPKKPVSTGPWKFKSFKPGEESSYTRFENYWDAPNAANCDELVTLNLVDDTARVNALLSGQVDGIAGVPPAQVAQFQSNDAMTVLETDTGAMYPYFMRANVDPLSDVKVRQALRLAIDRDQVVENALAGYGLKGSDLYSPYDPAFASDLVRERDVEKAKALLKEAGQTKPTIPLTVAPLGTGVPEAGEIMVSSAAEAGFNLKLRKVDVPTLYGAYGDWWPIGPSYYPSMHYVTTTRLGWLPTSKANHSQWKNQQFASLYAQTMREPDEGKRKEMLHEMQRIQFDEGAALVMWFPKMVQATTSKVKGIPAEDRTGIGFGRARFNLAYFD